LSVCKDEIRSRPCRDIPGGNLMTKQVWLTVLCFLIALAGALTAIFTSEQPLTVLPLMFMLFVLLLYFVRPRKT